jgi:hypothetical protein
MPKKWSPIKITSVADVVAEDSWTYRALGRRLVSRVAVGRPAPDPSGQDWYCPLFFEHELDGWKAVYGVGPVDALMNALALVQSRFQELRPTPRGGRKRAARARRPTKEA